MDIIFCRLLFESVGWLKEIRNFSQLSESDQLILVESTWCPLFVISAAQVSLYIDSGMSVTILWIFRHWSTCQFISFADCTTNILLWRQMGLSPHFLEFPIFLYATPSNCDWLHIAQSWILLLITDWSILENNDKGTFIDYAPDRVDLFRTRSPAVGAGYSRVCTVKPLH